MCIRDSAAGATGDPTAGAAPHAAVPADGSTPVVAKEDEEEALKAIEWATNVKDHAFQVTLLNSLPSAVVEEQLRLYKARSCGDIVPHAQQKILVYPHLAQSRQSVAKAFAAELQSAGWVAGTRLPRNACTKFVKKVADVVKEQIGDTSSHGQSGSKVARRLPKEPFP